MKTTEEKINIIIHIVWFALFVIALLTGIVIGMLSRH